MNQKQRTWYLSEIDSIQKTLENALVEEGQKRALQRKEAVKKAFAKILRRPPKVDLRSIDFYHDYPDFDYVLRNNISSVVWDTRELDRIKEEWRQESEKYEEVKSRRLNNIRKAVSAARRRIMACKSADEANKVLAELEAASF